MATHPKPARIRDKTAKKTYKLMLISTVPIIHNITKPRPSRAIPPAIIVRLPSFYIAYYIVKEPITAATGNAAITNPETVTLYPFFSNSSGKNGAITD